MFRLSEFLSSKRTNISFAETNEFAGRVFAMAGIPKRICLLVAMAEMRIKAGCDAGVHRTVMRRASPSWGWTLRLQDVDLHGHLVLHGHLDARHCSHVGAAHSTPRG